MLLNKFEVIKARNGDSRARVVGKKAEEFQHKTGRGGGGWREGERRRDERSEGSNGG